MARKPPPPGKGGARPGAGRKSLPATELKKKLGDYANDAMDAYFFIKALICDVSQPIAIRKECAIEIMNRHWGKHKQAVEVSGELALSFADLVSRAEKERGLSPND